MAGFDGRTESWAWGGPSPTESDPVQQGLLPHRGRPHRIHDSAVLIRLPAVDIETTWRTFPSTHAHSRLTTG